MATIKNQISFAVIITDQRASSKLAGGWAGFVRMSVWKMSVKVCSGILLGTMKGIN